MAVVYGNVPKSGRVTRNVQPAPPKVEFKMCSRCRSIKPLPEFGLCAKGKDGRRSYCRSCERAYRLDSRGVDMW